MTVVDRDARRTTTARRGGTRPRPPVDPGTRLDARLAALALSGDAIGRPTLLSATVEFEMVKDLDDEDFLALEDAFLARLPIEIAVMDGDIEEVGSSGRRMTVQITNFSESQPLENAILVKVVMKPTYSAHPPEAIDGIPSSSE